MNADQGKRLAANKREKREFADSPAKNFLKSMFSVPLWWKLQDLFMSPAFTAHEKLFWWCVEPRLELAA